MREYPESVIPHSLSPAFVHQIARSPFRLFLLFANMPFQHFTDHFNNTSMTPLEDNEHERRDSYFDNEVPVDTSHLATEAVPPQEQLEYQNPHISSLKTETYHSSSDNLLVNL